MDIEFLETEEIVDTGSQAIIIPTNCDMWISSKIGQEILVHGSDKIEMEAMAQAPVELGDVVVTSAGYIKEVKAILHAAVYGGKRWFPSLDIITKATYRSLEIAHEQSFESLALPILGEVNSKSSLEQISEAMWQGLHDFLKSYEDPKINALNFVIGDEETLDRFFDAFAAAQEKAAAAGE